MIRFSSKITYSSKFGGVLTGLGGAVPAVLLALAMLGCSNDDGNADSGVDTSTDTDADTDTDTDADELPVVVRLTDDDAEQSIPDVNAGRVVFMDQRSGDWNIHMIDLASGAETVICDEEGDQYSPVIHGDWVLWHEERGGVNTDVYGYNLETGTESVIAGGDGYQYMAQLHGSWVVFSDGVDKDGDGMMDSINVTAVNIDDQTRVEVTSGEDTMTSPVHIHGTSVVWGEARDGDDYEIFLHDLASGAETQLTSDDKYQSWPRIEGERVVYRHYWDDDGEVSDIFTLLTTTPTPEQLTNSSSDPLVTFSQPDISGDRVVYTKTPDTGEPDVYLVLLEQGLTIAIDSQPDAMQRGAHIDGDVMVWIDERHGNSDLFAYSITNYGCLTDGCEDDLDCTFTGECVPAS